MYRVAVRARPARRARISLPQLATWVATTVPGPACAGLNDDGWLPVPTTRSQPGRQTTGQPGLNPERDRQPQPGPWCSGCPPADPAIGPAPAAGGRAGPAV